MTLYDISSASLIATMADSTGGTGAVALGLFILVGAEQRARVFASGVATRTLVSVTNKVRGGLQIGRNVLTAIDQTLANVATIIGGVSALCTAAYGMWKWNKKKNEENARKAKQLDDLPKALDSINNSLEVLRSQADLAEKRYNKITSDYETLFSMLSLHSQTSEVVRRKLSIQHEMLRLGMPKTDTWYICDKEGKCTDASDGLCALFGRGRDKMLGNGWIGPVVDKEAAYAAWEHAVRDDIVPYESTYRINVAGKISNIATRAEKIVVTGETLYVGDCWVIEEELKPV